MPRIIKDGPHPIDIHVGGRVRLRRKALGISQEALADKIELTFQQVQKYERGSNRISASKLYETAKALGVKVQYFFEGYGDDSDPEYIETVSEASVAALLATKNGFDLAVAFSALTPKMQARIVALAQAIAGGD